MMRGKQVGSIYRFPEGFWAITKIDAPVYVDGTFPTFAEADAFVWANYA